MSKQKESISPSASSKKDVDKGRRRLSKAALATPVIASLASRQALAGNCLSNMLSGNLSNPDRGQCSKGWSPGGWGQPGGNIGSYSTLGAWTAAGFTYGNYNLNCGFPNKPTCYTGGDKMSKLSSLNKNSVPSNTLLRKVLDPSTWPQGVDWQLTRHLVCAYLNAALSEASPSFQYILTKQQVLDLAAGTTPIPPGYANLQAFLGSTWN